MVVITRHFSHRVFPTQAALIIEPVGTLDNHAAMSFEKNVTTEITAGYPKVIFDFRELDFMSSSGIRVLVVARNLVKASGGVVAVCNLKSHIREVIELSGINRIVHLCDDRKSAFAAVR